MTKGKATRAWAITTNQSDERKSMGGRLRLMTKPNPRVTAEVARGSIKVASSILAVLVDRLAMAMEALGKDIRVIAVETAGADSLAQSLAAGKLVELDAITSIARNDIGTC